MILFLLAVAGSALLLTQSVIFAPLRTWLAWRSEPDPIYAPGRGPWPELICLRLAAILSKLVSCPMCAGFWLGIAWGTGMFQPSFAAALFCYGPAGSLASALGVAVWLLLVEVRDAAGMWRYLSQPKE